MERIYADTSGGTIKLGRQGENEAREIIFDISSWTSSYGVGVASLVHKRHGDEFPYPCDIERNGDELVWTVKLADVANNGVGECELIYTVDNIVVKSIIWSTFVAKSLTDELEDAPKPEQSWVDRVIAAAGNMKDGFSPKVNVTPIEEGYRITIIDADHSETFDITNGDKGDKGDPGNVDGITVEGVDLPVEAGKVALPIGSANNAGLFKTSLAHGITSYKDELRINPAAVSNIDSRSTPKPIVPSNLNYAVKAALTDENRISGLTKAEKKNACSTIGAVYDGQYELIEEITLTETVDSITRTTDTQGNSYNFKSVLIYAQLAANTENSSLRVYVNGLADTSITAQNAISTGARYDKMVIDCNGGVISGTNINASNISGSSNIASTALLAFGRTITSINIDSTKGIPSGTNIKIYAVRA